MRFSAGRREQDREMIRPRICFPRSTTIVVRDPARFQLRGQEISRQHLEVVMNRNLVGAAGAAVLALLCVGVGCGQHNRASGGSAASQAQSGKVSLSSTRKVEASDPVYQMTAYTLEVPSDWKYAGTIARGTGCHATGASLKYTAQTPDGLTAIVQMPGVSWSWSSSQQM